MDYSQGEGGKVIRIRIGVRVKNRGKVSDIGLKKRHN
jgi:hypothetical protein